MKRENILKKLNGAKLTCTKCGKKISRLERFSKGECLECHKKGWKPGNDDASFIKRMGQ